MSSLMEIYDNLNYKYRLNVCFLVKFVVLSIMTKLGRGPNKIVGKVCFPPPYSSAFLCKVRQTYLSAITRLHCLTLNGTNGKIA